MTRSEVKSHVFAAHEALPRERWPGRWSPPRAPWAEIGSAPRHTVVWGRYWVQGAAAPQTALVIYAGGVWTTVLTCQRVDPMVWAPLNDPGEPGGDW